ncbi:MAG TPA: MFS transporter [Bryobacteraceae bacterium]|nr:MFS transporter [Bryobacteraceae bacterium]
MSPAAEARRSRIPVRYGVVAFAVSLAMLTYLDRICISILAPLMMREFGLTQIQMSYVFSAFTLTYGIFEIPTAWWADRVGSRRVVARIVAWWSVFAMATGAAFSYVSLVTVRLLFGVGEAGAWPNVARVFSRWIPAGERGRMQGIFFAGAHLSGGLTPILVTAMLGFLNWREVFAVCGALGFFWTVAWWHWFRDEPADHASVSPAELEKILRERGLPLVHKATRGVWGRILKHPSFVPLCLMYLANTYGFYFLITWLPTYLAKVRGFSQAELGIFAGLPLTLSVAGDLAGGWTTDRLTRRFGLRVGRCSVGAGAYLVAAAAMAGAAVVTGPRTAAILIAVAAAASMFTLAPSWAVCIDIGGHHAGVLSAAMNTSGQVGGVMSPIVLAYVVAIFSNWAIPLYLLAGLYLMASLCWLVIRPDHPLEMRAAA